MNSPSPHPGNAAEPILLLGELRLDSNLRALFRGEHKIHITPKPFGVLEYLARNRHRVVSKQELLEMVWGEVREPGTVEQAIRQLRRALGDDADNARYIETVAGEGYRLIAEAPAAQPEASRKAPKRMPWLVAAGATVLLVCVGAFFAFRHIQQRSKIASVSLTRNSVVALDPRGDVLWAYPFEARLRDPMPDWLAVSARMVDLGGKGVPMVLVHAGFAEGSAADQILCLSARGKLLWSYQPEERLKFGGWTVSGPWVFEAMSIGPENGPQSVYLAVSHNTWWPSFVVKVSPSGAHQIVFVSSGNVRAMRRVQTKSGAYILAAGINNEYRRASLTIMAEDGPAATTPQNEATYLCTQGCPANRPYRFILFPRSELSLASDVPYNIAIRIDERPDGITVSTDETGGTGGAQYDFSRELEPEQVSWGDNWGQLHRRFERQGLIKHTFEHCPELTTPAILAVCDQNGKWSTVSVPRRRWPY